MREKFIFDTRTMHAQYRAHPRYPGYTGELCKVVLYARSQWDTAYAVAESHWHPVITDENLRFQQYHDEHDDQVRYEHFMNSPLPPTDEQRAKLAERTTILMANFAALRRRPPTQFHPGDPNAS